MAKLPFVVVDWLPKDTMMLINGITVEEMDVTVTEEGVRFSTKVSTENPKVIVFKESGDKKS